MPPIFAREALPPPVLPVNCNLGKVVQFRHPAYPDSAPPLLRLGAIDGHDWDGLDFDVATTACSIVTTVDWSQGVMAIRTQDGSFSAVERPEDGLLRDRLYFWCRRCPDGGIDPDVRTDRYPVYLSFQHWRFPHSKLPEPWCRVTLPEYGPEPDSVGRFGKQAAIDCDRSCRITTVNDACETAHLIPYNENNWFVSNGMGQYARRPMAHLLIEDERNLIFLRRDLHLLFDQRRYVFVPKLPPPPQSPLPSHQQLFRVMASHVLLPEYPQFANMYHNRLTQEPLRGLSLEFLFARFAWAVFHDEFMPFFSGDGVYAVRIWDKAAGHAEDKTLSKKDIASFARIFEPEGSKSRNVSPKKRSLSVRDRDLCDQSDYGESDWGDAQADWDDEENTEQWTRGRSLHRTRNSIDTPSLDDSFVASASVTSPASQGNLAEITALVKRDRQEDCGNSGERSQTDLDCKRQKLMH
ncbi:uncharacterized protein PpBr36_10489 [Pyricularia pennisetigena]|uniref:uncharacterized protein n=1 Tax=Pyricularia pennisetigena TaxID=1578925 RepID=UPI00114E91D6|nr:uncharacterized protein PpBr36_10489 [Pyricularia pennisetigena]TLS21104.1 hypothetical protein PpBr36_10489 [Pyricularia pennisetigena]